MKDMGGKEGRYTRNRFEISHSPTREVPTADHPAGLGEADYVESEAVTCRLRRPTTLAGLFMGGGLISSALTVIIPIFWLEGP